MAHNENFADENSQHCVDERREHAPVLTESVAFEEFDRWMDLALDGWSIAGSHRLAQSGPATILGPAVQRRHDSTPWLAQAGNRIKHIEKVWPRQETAGGQFC